jgi:hypothetical protein
MANPARSTAKPSGTPTLHQFQQAARKNVAERTPSDLSVEDVQQIRAFRASGARCISIAQQFKIDRRDVSKICKFNVRADVPRPFETDAQRSWREQKHRDNEREAKVRLEKLAAKKAKKDGADADKAGAEPTRARGEG